MPFYSESELQAMGWRSLGHKVRVSRLASIHNPQRIELGDHARIDDFCVLSAGAGGIEIGRHVHVGTHSTLIGAARIVLKDFSGLSSRVSVYSSSDDYSGRSMTNPTVPQQLTDVRSEPVTLGRHVIVGAGSVILPGVTLHDGSGVGALSLVRRDCVAFGMYHGNPARRIGTRKAGMLALEARLLEDGPAGETN